MQYMTAFLRRAVKLAPLSFSNNLYRLPLNWTAVIQSCLLDGRGYATTMADTRPGYSSLCKFTPDDSKHCLECKAMEPSEVQEDHQALEHCSSSKAKVPGKKAIGENISSKDKNKFLLNMVFALKDSKESIYGALDAWVAWERIFPLVSLKRVLIMLEKEEQWHRVVQVIKWMLSKGQGTTMGTYEQLIRALEKDHRAEEAHKVWVKKIGHDLHSVPWRVCDLMISIYYRNSMLERLVKLFEGLESFDRKPPSKLIVQKVADAHEMLGLLEEKKRVLDKYSALFCKTTREHPRKSQRALRKFRKKADGKEQESSEPSEDG
uniref:Pentatricopeptide repeat-containing protein At4g21190 n=1 Tax=Anthurium amnicola TaxID=1678845 RepID=A0A1D1ZKF5_9ARAE